MEISKKSHNVLPWNAGGYTTKIPQDVTTRSKEILAKQKEMDYYISYIINRHIFYISIIAIQKRNKKLRVKRLDAGSNIQNDSVFNRLGPKVEEKRKITMNYNFDTNYKSDGIFNQMNEKHARTSLTNIKKHNVAQRMIYRILSSNK